jgi:hypothetical protein
MSAESTVVKIYNLTDVHTPVLEKYRMLDQHIAVGTRMCEPGQYIEQEDSPTLRENCRHLVSIGALSIGMVPPPYTVARTSKASGGVPSPVHVQHLNVQETKVADSTPAPAPAVEAEVAPAEPKPAPRARK